jgi:putative transposase
LTSSERLSLVERAATELPLTIQTKLLSLNRSSLYYRRVPPSPQEVALKHRIDEIYTDRPYYGVRRITAQLRREGVLVNHKAVARHMREMGLTAIYPGPNLSKRAQQAAIYPYLLRDVTAAYPNHIWGIELVFKRLKQLLRVADLRCHERAAVEATVRALLVAWALQEQVAAEVRALLPSGAGDPSQVASSWLLAGLSVQSLRMQVRGSWTLACLRACLPRLVRFLVSSPRKRRQHEADIRQWLEERLCLAPPLLEAA